MRRPPVQPPAPRPWVAVGAGLLFAVVDQADFQLEVAGVEDARRGGLAGPVRAERPQRSRVLRLRPRAAQQQSRRAQRDPLQLMVHGSPPAPPGAQADPGRSGAVLGVARHAALPEIFDLNAA